MKVFRELEAAIAAEPIRSAPFEPVKSTDHTVGVCSDQVKRIVSHRLTLAEKLGDYEACIEAEAKGEEDRRRRASWIGIADSLRNRITLLDSLMWLTIHEDIPELLIKPYVAVRKDWMVVYCDQPSHRPEGGAHADVIFVIKPVVNRPPEHGNN